MCTCQNTVAANNYGSYRYFILFISTPRLFQRFFHVKSIICHIFTI